MDFEANGTFTTVDPQKEIRLNIPGSSITVIPPTTIQYKNALGVFTLIEKPTNLSASSSRDSCPGGLKAYRKSHLSSFLLPELISLSKNLHL